MRITGQMEIPILTIYWFIASVSQAEQLDGFLDTLGISYDKNRINGKKLLEWEAKSNLDVRGIVAIALNESSLGTAGVATNPGANMFGFGAYDSNPEYANNFNDEIAVVELTQQTIIGNKNQTFKIQDDKAKKFANGTLNPATDGGVYFTDTTGSGKRRAETMQKLDAFIDEHGGTPKAPEQTTGKTRDGGGVTSNDIPVGYSLTTAIDTTGYITSTILGDNVPGMSSTVENKSESTLIHLWEMVDNG
ncbi:immunogenic secreted protein [Streptococcus parasanguinis]|nr:immunogenic secreted protein [Streptococcus parasanguinis]